MSKKDMEKNEVSKSGTDDNKKPGSGKKLKFGSMSIIVIVLVIAIVVVVNLMVGLLMKRYPLKVDLTPDSRHEIGEQSIEVMKNLDKDVQITVAAPRSYFDYLASQNEEYYLKYYDILVECPYEIIPEILDKYSVYAEAGKGSVSVRYVDISKDPDVVADLNKNFSGEITQGSIAVSCGDRVKVISPASVAAMITPSQDSQYPNINMVFAGESVITSAIRDVADANIVKAAVVSSVNSSAIYDNTHSYVALSLENFLSKNGYDCEEIDLGRITAEELISDYDLVVICGPSIDFSEDIIQKMQDYLNNGGNYDKDMIYVQNMTQTNQPNLDAFLDDWKLKVEPALVLDDSNMVQVGSTFAVSIGVADDSIVGELENSSLPIVAPYARPVVEVTKNSTAQVSTILATQSTGYLQPFSEDAEVSKDKGSYGVVVKSSKAMSVGISVHESNLVVIGSPLMFDDTILAGNNTYSNSNALLNTFNNISGKEAAVAIHEKALELHTLSLTNGGARAILIVVVVVIPLLIAIAGVSVLLWRRNR